MEPILSSLSNDARDSLQRVRHAHQPDPSLLATDLATVMGPRLLAEQPSVAELEEALKAVTDLPHCHNEEAIDRQIADHISSTVVATLKRAADTAATTASDKLIVPATPAARGLTESLDASEKALAKLISEIGGASGNEVS